MRRWHWTGKRARGRRKSGRRGRKVSASRGAWRGWPYAPVPPNPPQLNLLRDAFLRPQESQVHALLKCRPASGRRGAP